MKPLWPAWPLLRDRICRSEHLFLFLDYDGTLAPIAAHPQRVRLPAGTRKLLGKLCSQRGLKVALISGRALGDLERQAGLPGLIYVGNHGLEIRAPGLRYLHPKAAASRSLLARIARLLRGAVREIPGAWVEDKRFGLSLHYRNVADADVKRLQGAFAGVARPWLRQHTICVTTGKRVLEVRPGVRWSKGSVVRWLLRRLRTGVGRRMVLPVYIGDDRTDEDAFEVLKGRGITVAVGRSDGRTRAVYGVDSPEQVIRFLRGLLTTWLRKENCGAAP